MKRTDKRKRLCMLLVLCVALSGCRQRSEGRSRMKRNTAVSMTKQTVSSAPSVIELRSAADLEQLRSDPEGDFVLAQDITVGGSFQPFGEFNGTLDGQGHWIRGFRLNVCSEVTDGLFTSFGQNAEVRNLNLEVSAVVTETLPTHISGLVGVNGGKISNCTVRSDITGGTDYKPIVYSNYGTIRDCTVTTTAKNVEKVYGVTGENSGELLNCVIEIKADECNFVSGLTYRNWEKAEGCSVTVTATGISGFVCVGSQNHAQIRRCVFNAKLTPAAGVMPRWDTCGNKDNDSDFDSSNKVNVQVITKNGHTSIGRGTQSDPYRLREPGDLEMLRTDPNAYFSLENDIDFSDAIFTPVTEFSGVLDGNGHTVRGINFKFVSGENNYAAALIRNLKQSAIVENLTLECSMDAGTREKTDGAGITICNDGTVRNCTVTAYAENCYAFGGITRNNTATGVIENCKTTITTVDCSFVGGIAEYQSGTVQNCSAELSLAGVRCLGGIAYANGGSISSCSASGFVRTSFTDGYLAGLVGENLQSGRVTASKASVSNTTTREMLPSIGNQ